MQGVAPTSRASSRCAPISNRNSVSRPGFACPLLFEFLMVRRLTVAHSPESKRFIIVTGAGRSGTSAVARTLHESGLSMGQDFGPPSEFNPVGFYEELAVRELNDRIMADCGMTGLERWPRRSTVLATGQQYGQLMDDLVAASSAEGWKDPRFCLTLEAWLPHLPARPKVVACLRSPEAFVHSAISIFGLSARDVLERWWANHLRRILDVIQDYDLAATCVVYEDLVQRPEATVGELSSFIGHPLDAAYVEPALQHFAQRVPQRYQALYEEVRALSSDEPLAHRQTGAGPR